MTTQGPSPQPITFAEWAYLGKGKYHRRDFRFDTLTQMSSFGAEDTLFAELGKHEIFTPTRDHGPLSVADIAGGLPDMTEQVALRLRNRNPDVLTCIANLSNDEVFTPPEFANQMLDLVADAWADANDGANIWADPTVTFLDPFTKSGVFLREITSRLTDGLEDEIPDLEERVDHILTKQVFGIGITQLTSLLARRSVYCSKWANGKHSIAKSFTTQDGNIWFERMEHTWVGGTEWVITADADGKPIEKFTERQVQVLRRQPEGTRPWRGPRDSRLRLHPHRRHQGSDRRAVRRRHAVRRHHRQPALPARRRGLRH